VITLGNMRNSSPAFAGPPFGSANKRVSGFGTSLHFASANAVVKTLHILGTLCEVTLGDYNMEILEKVTCFVLNKENRFALIKHPYKI